MTWLGTGRVWSLEMIVQVFLPFASSLRRGLPIGWASASATSSSSDAFAVYSCAWETRTPATSSSGSENVTFSLPNGTENYFITVFLHPSQR